MTKTTKPSWSIAEADSPTMYSLQNCLAITLTDGGAVVCPNRKRAWQVDADSPMDEAGLWNRTSPALRKCQGSSCDRKKAGITWDNCIFRIILSTPVCPSGIFQIAKEARCCLRRRIEYRGLPAFLLEKQQFGSKQFLLATGCPAVSIQVLLQWLVEKQVEPNFSSNGQPIAPEGTTDLQCYWLHHG